MVDQALPPWRGDPLWTFLSNAQWNERALAVNVPDLYAVRQRVHGAFERLAVITEKDRHGAPRGPENRAGSTHGVAAEWQHISAADTTLERWRTSILSPAAAFLGWWAA